MPWQLGRLGTRSDIAVFLVFRMLSLEELIRRAEQIIEMRILCYD
jgi:hypothetical protein